MLDGLDEALTGLSAGESATFSTELAGGEAEGEDADVTVTVQSVKVRDCPSSTMTSPSSRASSTPSTSCARTPASSLSG